MNFKVLKLKISKNPISYTKLSRSGTWLETDKNEQAYELTIDFYHNNTLDKSLVVSEKYYNNILPHYSMDDLLDGVKIDSLLNIISSIGIDADILFEEEVSAIADKILNEFPALELTSNELIFKHIMSLKDKFKIQPK